MIERHPLPTTPASDAVPWVLGNQLQPHRGRWLVRRLRSGPWVFLGLSGLRLDVRIQGFRGGEAEMSWKDQAPGGHGRGAATREAQPVLRGPEGSMGSAGPPGRDARAERAPGGPISGAVSGPTRTPVMPVPIGMFIFQQPAPPGSASRRPIPAAPTAGIFDGRTGGMTTAGMARSPVSAGGPSRQEAPGMIFGAASPGWEPRGTGMQQGVPPGPPPAPERPSHRTDRLTPSGHQPAVGDAAAWEVPVETTVFREGPTERFDRGQAGHSRMASSSKASDPAFAPALGVLARTLALLPGIGFRPQPMTLEGGEGYPASSRAEGGQKFPALPAPDPGVMLPLRHAGGIAPAGPGPAIPVWAG
ncbi:hypothetical protein, partial [Desulfococcus sp.]|uniref:hypothetical protein n=1 Tax=Desulfococcus sp. TaxID=2025834 RepID=UPI003592FB94